MDSQECKLIVTTISKGLEKQIECTNCHYKMFINSDNEYAIQHELSSNHCRYCGAKIVKD